MTQSILYVRVSTAEQNTDRQTTNTQGYDQTIIDKCSGSIPLDKRPGGEKLLKLVATGTVGTITVHSIDRLGRNAVNILQNIEALTAAGINVISIKEGLQTLTPTGERNRTAALMLGILLTFAEFEREISKERQREGITAAQKAGRIIGRKAGTKEDPADFLQKRKPAEILRYLNQKRSTHEISKLCRCSLSTVTKVKKAAGLM